MLLLPELLPAQPAFVPPPKREVRAVWIATAAGLDWPKSLDRTEQQSALVKMVYDLKGANFNTIYFQARARGDAYYRSAYEPWAENLTGTMGRDPGWDPLEFLLEEAHRNGIEVHAWINVYKIRSANGFPASPLHPSRSSPDWVVPYAGEEWLDPGIPGVRDYLVNVVLDLVRHYDVDGINFDYMRYPARDFDDDRSYRKYGGGLGRDEWRLQNITRFVTEVYTRATALKPMLKVGSSPLGVVSTDLDPDLRGGLRQYYQDAPSWLRAGKQDYISPQIYWNIGATRNDPDFAGLVRAWERLSSGRQVVAGIAAYKPEVAREIAAEIDTVRAARSDGQAYFRYENIQGFSLFGSRYHTLANIPPMPWKDAIPPLAPTNLAVSESSTNVFTLEWKAPRTASDGDRARYYNIYRSTTPSIDVNNPFSLVAITTGDDCFYVDSVKTPSGVTYSYAVTALDKGNNESDPSNVAGAAVREILALKNRMSSSTTLTTSFSHDAGRPTLLAYRLERRTPVTLAIYKEQSNGQDSLYTTLTHEIQPGATYVVGLSNIRFDQGRYVIRMNAGETGIEQKFDVER